LRQFTQFGVEIINPKNVKLDYLIELAQRLIKSAVDGYEIITDTDVTRGLDYYVGGKGFEIKCESLGAQKQLCGGGEYKGGIGFAIGIDRLMLLD